MHVFQWPLLIACLKETVESSSCAYGSRKKILHIKKLRLDAGNPALTAVLMFPCREFYGNFENDLEHEELEDGEVHGEDDGNAGIEAADLDNHEDQEERHSYENDQL